MNLDARFTITTFRYHTNNTWFTSEISTGGVVIFLGHVIRTVVATVTVTVAVDVAATVALALALTLALALALALAIFLAFSLGAVWVARVNKFLNNHNIIGTHELFLTR